MKAIVLTALAVLFLGAGGALAGHGRSCGGGEWDESKMNRKIDKKVNRLAKKLDLTPKQKTEIRQVMGQLAQDKKRISERIHREGKALWEDSEKKIRGILNPEQEKKFDKKMAKWKKKRGPYFRGH